MNHATPASNPVPARSRLLLVDDHEVGRKSLARLLEAIGFDVTSVADGSSALDALRLGPRFDYLFTDVRLPDLDGREIAQVARQHEPPPVIALITGWDIDPEECDRLGIDWLFLKPVNFQEMIAKLQRGRA